MSAHSAKSTRPTNPRGVFPPPIRRDAAQAPSSVVGMGTSAAATSAAVSSPSSAYCAPYRKFQILRGGQHAEVLVACLRDKHTPFVVKEYRRHCMPKHPSTPPSPLEQKPQREYLILKRMCHPNIVKLYEPATPKQQHPKHFNHNDQASAGACFPASDGAAPSQSSMTSSCSSSSSSKTSVVDTSSCIPLELMDLGSLKDVVSKLHQDPSITEQMLTALAQAIAVPALLGLQFLHAHQMIHRDVKPENLLLSRDGRAKWCDFDTTYCAAKLLHNSNERIGGGGPSDAGIGADTLGVGTDGYMAPELISGTGEKYTNAVDMWSLGVVLYWIVKRCLPEDIKSCQKIGERLRNNSSMEWSDMFQLENVLDEDFRSLLLGLLATKPAERTDAFSAIHHKSMRNANLYTGCGAEVLSGPSATEALLNVVQAFKTCGVTLYGDDGSERRELDELFAAMTTMSYEQKKEMKDKYKSVVFTRQAGAISWLKQFFAAHCNDTYNIVDKAKFKDWAEASGTPAVC